MGWTGGTEGGTRDRFVPMERPQWAEQRRALANGSPAARPHGSSLHSVVAVLKGMGAQKSGPGIVIVTGAGGSDDKSETSGNKEV